MSRITLFSRRILDSLSFIFRSKGGLNLILSLRGMLLLIFALYLWLGPGLQETDIVALILALTLMFMLFTFIFMSLGSALVLKKNFGVTVIPPKLEPQGRIESGEKISFLLRCTEVRLPPLFQITFRLEFERGRMETMFHVLRGTAYGCRFIQEGLKFPHRGIWHIKKIRARLQDQLGLTYYDWDLPAEVSGQSIYVYPPLSHNTRLPILSSCHKGGDTSIDLYNRQGDPFDLKPYHPSDGLRKIVWKIYAKSGELISRHAEPSMMPEGQVVVFCLAALEDDGVCSAALAYLRRLEELELEIFFGCEGAASSALARSAHAAEHLLIETAWQTVTTEPTQLVEQLDGFLASLSQELNNGKLENMLIFCSSNRLNDQRFLSAYLQCGAWLTQRGIKPVFIVIRPEKLRGPAHPATAGFPSRPTLYRLKRVLIKPPQEIRHTPDPFPAFASACMRNHWQVLE